MRLTRAAEYAIRCMVVLSSKGEGVLTSRKEIADITDAPPNFLTKIAQDLARANFIEIRQGAKGGFVLIRNPAFLSLLEVVEVMIGEISLNDCVAMPSSCPNSSDCSVHKVWKGACQQLRETLGTVTFDQLVRDKCSDPVIK